jgi:protein PhnA
MPLVDWLMRGDCRRRDEAMTSVKEAQVTDARLPDSIIKTGRWGSIPYSSWLSLELERIIQGHYFKKIYVKYCIDVKDQLERLYVFIWECLGPNVRGKLEANALVLTKDLKVKGSSVTLKRGTVITHIRLTDDPEEIEGRNDKVKGLVLRTEFVKKA